MTRTLVPPDPETVMVIRDVAPAVTTLSVPFLRFGRLRWGGRATIGMPAWPRRPPCGR